MRTEFEFTLPKGYVGNDGTLHRHGTMRLATARDEIEPLRDRTIDGPDDPYLTILVLARVITQLGSLPEIGIDEVEGLFAADLAFLQDLYGIINFGDQADVEALQASVLPDEPEVVDTPTATEADGSDETGDAELSGDAANTDDAPLGAIADDKPARPRRARVEEVVSSARE
ncbi:hypothetical protein [Ilumatobacter coccineus]|uniref:Phage tail assembly protein n=1 Tax=Ilumatobacter coccineus (strain NBRC 103263 / KCTC 29153 / YM16-304) TaxID=1313172 RepID=A0A6C7E873_ILUCY|nr:hypothetical protein [Ilumatobacter coccineus]BAN02620.1 hypothetical protein YM304_23060 [Ilumatobacter coccineus YM16-304]